MPLRSRPGRQHYERGLLFFRWAGGSGRSDRSNSRENALTSGLEDYTTKVFRHTFSTLIKSLGVDTKVVQELLRHASFKTTMDRLHAGIGSCERVRLDTHDFDYCCGVLWELRSGRR
ncbi:MAG: tyrosine-type recombinase/integrase [Candidatus Angelobacter sp.]